MFARSARERGPGHVLRPCINFESLLVAVKFNIWKLNITLRGRVQRHIMMMPIKIVWEGHFIPKHVV